MVHTLSEHNKGVPSIYNHSKIYDFITGDLEGIMKVQGRKWERSGEEDEL